MDENIVIRPVKPEDAEQYIKLTNFVWRDAYKHIFPEEVFATKESRAQDMIKTFADVVYHGKDKLCYVAEVESKIIGFVFARLGTNYEHFVNIIDAELMAMYILPEYQGKGLGTKFKNLFIDWAKDKGVKNFVLGVLKDNHKARKVYESWNGELDKYMEPFVSLGVEYDEVFYTFNL